jgi:hypothetical protein
MDSFVKYLVFAITAIASYFEPINGLVALVLVLFTVDFITGFIKSIKVTRKVSVKSKKLRWSVVKMFVYLSVIALTFLICEIMSIGIDATLAAVKIEVWCIIYIEGLSIVENLKVIFPEDKFLGFLHYLLAIEFLKYVPALANFLKDKEDETTN